MAAVIALLRLLGIDVMTRLGRRLPPPLARVVSALMLIGANLLPVWAVLEGRLGMGDVLLIYWFENVVIWFTTTVRILTTTRSGRRPDPARLTGLERSLAQRTWVSGDPASAILFVAHFGIFTLVHGVFSIAFAVLAGLHGSPLDWASTIAAILVSHGFSLGLHWFGRNERATVSAGWLMVGPYPRLFALHLTVIVGFFYLGGPDGRTADDLGAVALLMGAKTALDLLFHLGEHVAMGRAGRRAERARAARKEAGREDAQTMLASRATQAARADPVGDGEDARLDTAAR
jgi:hypothetical protein